MSVNDFNRGIETQARTHYAFMRKQGDASAELGKRIIKKIDQLGNVVDVLIDELNQQKMDQVFGVCSSLDIGKNLEKSEQIILLSYLKALSVHKGQNTQQQLDYFFAVKRYLNIGNVTDTIDFNSVSELDLSRTELKAFLECVCEFLFLKFGNKVFLKTFSEEIDCFGFNDKIVNEIVNTIEKTYEFFGIQGIVEHYSLEPIKSEKEEFEPITIPFFEKPIIIIYDEDVKHNAECAELLKATIHERLKKIGAKEAVEIAIINEKDSESKKQLYEDSRHIIYIGIPKQAKSLKKIMKWEFNKFGMKYGTFGEKSIIAVNELNKKGRKAFAEYVKQNAKQWEKVVKEAVKDAEPILSNAFADSKDVGKGAAIFTNIMISTIGSPLLLFSAAFDLCTHDSFQKKLLKFQHFVAIDSFISSKIDPFLKKQKDHPESN